MTDRQTIFVVKLNVNGECSSTLLKAFSSRLVASHYIESRVKDSLKDRFDPSKGIWEDAWTYVYETDNGNHCYEIEEVDVEQDVALPYLPLIEQENLALKAENKELREKLSHAEGLNAAAKCYLTMYDGGWKYAKEHVIENMHAARSILEDGKPGNDKITEMFEDWQKIRLNAAIPEQTEGTAFL